MIDEATFTSDARLFTAIKENFVWVYARYSSEWGVYQLTTDAKNGRPDYADGPSTAEFDKHVYDPAQVVETRKEVFEAARQMHDYVNNGYRPRAHKSLSALYEIHKGDK